MLLVITLSVPMGLPFPSDALADCLERMPVIDRGLVCLKHTSLWLSTAGLMVGMDVIVLSGGVDG